MVAIGSSFVVSQTDIILSAEYRIAQVLDVQPVAGADASERLVVVDLGDKQRALKTSDWLLQTKVGHSVCVRRAEFVVKRWVKHSLALPGFCKDLCSNKSMSCRLTPQISVPTRP